MRFSLNYTTTGRKRFASNCCRTVKFTFAIPTWNIIVLPAPQTNSCLYINNLSTSGLSVSTACKQFRVPKWIRSQSPLQLTQLFASRPFHKHTAGWTLQTYFPKTSWGHSALVQNHTPGFIYFNSASFTVLLKVAAHTIEHCRRHTATWREEATVASTPRITTRMMHLLPTVKNKTYLDDHMTVILNDLLSYGLQG